MSIGEIQKVRCLMCDEVFQPTRINQLICAPCRKVVPYRQSELLKNDYDGIVEYRRRYKATGVRFYLVPMERELAKNIGPACECPDDCKYKGITDGAASCDYTFRVGCSRPKDAGPIGKECKCYTPGRRQEEIERARRQFVNGRFTW